MLRITVCTSAEAAITYHRTGLKGGDYYSQGQETPGVWFGKGTERLGLVPGSMVDDAVYEHLCHNRTPTGEQLTPVTRAGRRVAYDFTFNCPKSVSLALVLENDQRIIDTFQFAVRQTMVEIEQDMRTRVRIDGGDTDRLTGNLVAAEYVHRTARPINGVPDPHLHAHVVVHNATYDEVENRFKAGQFGEIKRDAPYFEAIFHSHLSKGLADLGYLVERRGTRWEMGGMERSLIEAFSTRTTEIEAEAKRRGIIDPEAKADLGRKTRKSKAKTLPMDEVEVRWRGQATKHGYAGLANGGSQNEVRPSDAIEYALAKGLERASVLRERDLLADAWHRGAGTLDVIEVRKALADRAGLIRRELDGDALLTTHEALAEEQAVLDYARKGLNTLPPVAASPRIVVEDRLSGEQRRAVDHVLTSTDRVAIIRGRAGTGKTALLQDAIEQTKSASRNVVVLASSIDASRGVLREAGFAKADTVARFLVDPAMQHQARDGVIVVDEAGQLGMKTMNRLFTEARAVNARVWLIGDTRQHAPVERGDSLRLLENEAGVRPAEVRAIRRQRDPAYREAVSQLASGNTLKGLMQLDRLGSVRSFENDGERFAALAADYAKHLQSGRTVLAIAPTHVEGQRASDAIRHTLREIGVVHGDNRKVSCLKRLEWSLAERQDAQRFEPGMVLQFQRAAAGFKSGEKITVQGLDHRGQILGQRTSGASCTVRTESAACFAVYRRSELELAVGDRIRTTGRGIAEQTASTVTPSPARRRRSNTELKPSIVNAGRSLIVGGFTDTGGIVTTSGLILGSGFEHVSHDYVTTSHAAQGKTVDVVLVAQSAESGRAASQEQFYVSASRARDQATIYTDSKGKLLEAVQRSSARTSATQLAKMPMSPALAQHIRLRREAEEAAYPRQQLAKRAVQQRVTQERAPVRVRERGRER